MFRCLTWNHGASVYSTHFNFPPIKMETRKRKREEETIRKKKKGGLSKSEFFNLARI
jgi:hypothetical protein